MREQYGCKYPSSLVCCEAVCSMALGCSYLASIPGRNTTEGKAGDQHKKSDAGKLRWSLLTVQFRCALRGICRILDKGADKYPEPPKHQSWRTVEDGVRRYKDAFDRHADWVNADIGYYLEHKHGLEGVSLDRSLSSDFKELHIDHMITNLLFLRDLLYGRDRDLHPEE